MTINSYILFFISIIVIGFYFYFIIGNIRIKNIYGNTGDPVIKEFQQDIITGITLALLGWLTYINQKFGTISLTVLSRWILAIVSLGIATYITRTTWLSWFSGFNSMTFLYIALFLFMIVAGMAIAYRIFYTQQEGSSWENNILIQFLLFLPCLLTDFLEHVNKQIGITPNIVFVLFLMELIAILLFISIPYFLQKSATLIQGKGTPILKESAFLDIQTALPPFHSLKTNYAISLWTYINPQPASDKEYLIFTINAFMPIITYRTHDTRKEQKEKEQKEKEQNKIIVHSYSKNPKQKQKQEQEFDVKLQKWTNIVLNYRHNMCDVFIDGTLQKTFECFEPPPIHSVFIGEHNGLYGAICNVMYYPEPLTQSHIVTMYNVFSTKNQPTLF